MATTKKVARGKTVRKKTTKKVAVSKSVKKTTKKTVKKAVKRAAKKAPTTSVAKKNIVPKRTREQITSFDQKLEAVEILHKKKGETTDEKRVLSTLRVKKPVLRNRLALTIPVLPAVPANIDALAIQTARLSGVAFVILGGIFALNFSQALWGDPSAAMLANTYQQSVQQSGTQYQQSVQQAGAEYQELTQQSAEEYAAPEPLSSVYPECDGMTDQGAFDQCELDAQAAEEVLNSGDVQNPSININVSGGAGSVLNGNVNIIVSVSGVQSVDVYASESWNTEDFLLGAATRSSNPDRWGFVWDTTTVPDGTYTIKAVVYNYYNPDGYLDSGHSYEVDNTTESVLGTVEGVEPPVSLSVLSTQPVDDSVEFEIDVADAEEVRLLFRSAGGGALNTIPYPATWEVDDLWYHTWDTSAVPDGTYDVLAAVKNETSGDTYQGTSVQVTVVHPVAIVDDEEDVVIDLEDEETIVVDGDEEELPTVTIELPSQDPLSSFVNLGVRTLGAYKVDMYATKDGAATRRYIGRGTRSSSGMWAFSWNTNNAPNGDYTLIPVVTNAFGTYDGETEDVTVYNAMVYEQTEEQKQDLHVIEEAVKITEEIVNQQPAEGASEPKEVSTSTTSSEGTTEVKTEEQQEEEKLDDLIADFNEDIDKELQRFASAYRTGDQDRIDAAYERLATLKANITAQLRSSNNEDDLLGKINIRIDKIIEQYRVQIDAVDTLIEERVSQEVFKDSDNDGITDYDEVALFNTDPFAADSDGDGFNDGVEVESGYDPTDARRETAIEHESPKETGVVRADILKVEQVVPLIAQVESVEEGVLKEAVHTDISGYALPNSYVTVYIFSTPVVVTVKTDEDGAWRYTFDEELEDGEHNVYVGVTDNAGKIVAKSEPFTFVKEAQAFSPVDTAIAGAADVGTGSANDSLLSQYMVYLIVSVSVVSIGLVLILLGMHLDARTRRAGAVVQGASEADQNPEPQNDNELA